MQDYFFLPPMFNYLEEKEDSGVFGKVGAIVITHVEKRSSEKVGATTHIRKEKDAGFFLRIKEFWWGSGEGPLGRRGWWIMEEIRKVFLERAEQA